jgi:hypothetical protein
MNLTQEFSISVKGSTTGEDYKGIFKVRPRLNLQKRLYLDQARRELVGPRADEASKDAASIAIVFSKIWAHLEDAPGWWKEAKNGLELEDDEPVTAVFDKICEIETESLKALSKDGEKAAEELKKAQ